MHQQALKVFFVAMLATMNVGFASVSNAADSTFNIPPPDTLLRAATRPHPRAFPIGEERERLIDALHGERGVEWRLLLKSLSKSERGDRNAVNDVRMEPDSV